LIKITPFIDICGVGVKILQLALESLVSKAKAVFVN